MTATNELIDTILKQGLSYSELYAVAQRAKAEQTNPIPGNEYRHEFESSTRVPPETPTGHCEWPTNAIVELGEFRGASVRFRNGIRQFRNGNYSSWVTSIEQDPERCLPEFREWIKQRARELGYWVEDAPAPLASSVSQGEPTQPAERLERRCEKCGGTTFDSDFPYRPLYCTNCGTDFPREQAAGGDATEQCTSAVSSARDDTPPAAQLSARELALHFLGYAQSVRAGQVEQWSTDNGYSFTGNLTVCDQVLARHADAIASLSEPTAAEIAARKEECERIANSSAVERDKAKAELEINHFRGQSEIASNALATANQRIATLEAERDKIQSDYRDYVNGENEAVTKHVGELEADRKLDSDALAAAEVTIAALKAAAKEARGLLDRVVNGTCGVEINQEIRDYLTRHPSHPAEPSSEGKTNSPLATQSVSDKPASVAPAIDNLTFASDKAEIRSTKSPRVLIPFIPNAIERFMAIRSDDPSVREKHRDLALRALFAAIWPSDFTEQDAAVLRLNGAASDKAEVPEEYARWSMLTERAPGVYPVRDIVLDGVVDRLIADVRKLTTKGK